MGYERLLVEQTINIELITEAGIVFDVVSDLQTYPFWLDIVDKVTPDGEDAWIVTLTAKIGPIKRSKKLRMIKSTDGMATTFIRQETHGRDFSIWKMHSTVTPVSTNSSELTIELLYDGPYWSNVLDALLDARKPKIQKSLESYLADKASETVK